jgi:hypothetical protein
VRSLRTMRMSSKRLADRLSSPMKKIPVQQAEHDEAGEGFPDRGRGVLEIERVVGRYSRNQPEGQPRKDQVDDGGKSRASSG